MKQIVLITRINAYQKEQEFSKYSNDMALELLPKFMSNHYQLLIINGYLLRELDDNRLMSEKILALAKSQELSKSEDTIIAYHNLEDFSVHIRQIFSNDGWNKLGITKYSSASDNDKPLYQLLTPLGEALKNNQPIEDLVAKLWAYFSGGTLEIKLNLLHAILKGEIPPLDAQLAPFETDYNNFTTQVNKSYDNENEGKREALKAFRDALLRAN